MSTVSSVATRQHQACDGWCAYVAVLSCPAGTTPTHTTTVGARTVFPFSTTSAILSPILVWSPFAYTPLLAGLRGQQHTHYIAVRAAVCTHRFWDEHGEACRCLSFPCFVEQNISPLVLLPPPSFFLGPSGCILLQIMGAITESRGFKGADTRVLVDSVVGFQALIDTGHINLLKVSAVSAARPPMRSQFTSSLLNPASPDSSAPCCIRA